MKAGVFGQEEPTKGVSASIICGKRARIGTGLCDLSMDIDKILNMN
jgi:DNA-directed RNA polymerase beta' subunit